MDRESHKVNILTRLMDHDRWATSELLKRCRDLEAAQLDQEFDIGHRTIRATLDHLNAGLAFWVSIMSGPANGQPAATGSLGDLNAAFHRSYRTQEPRTIEALTLNHERGYDTFATLAQRIQAQARLDETFYDDAGYSHAYGSAILMLILFNEGHRTEAVHMLARLGIPELVGVEVDYGLWDFVRRGIV